MALIRKNNIREMLYFAHLQKFSSAKISRYTVALDEVCGRQGWVKHFSACA